MPMERQHVQALIGLCVERMQPSIKTPSDKSVCCQCKEQ